jgi:serine/threonine-protein kinase
LIDAAKESQIWSERYDRVMEDIFDVQDDISRAIADTLKVKLTGAGPRRHTADSVAYELYLQGRHHLNKRTSENLLKAVGYLEQAIARDPEYALAHHALGYCFLVLAFMMRPGRDWTRKAPAAMRRACEADGRLAEAHAGLAFALTCQLQWAEANKELQCAIELDSSSAEVWDTSALVLAAQGRTDEGITHIGRSLAIEPLSLVFHHHAAWVMILGRRYDEAIARSRRAIELDPHFVLAHMWLAIACTLTGRFEEARREWQTPGADDGNLGLAYICAVSGEPEEARRLLREFTASAIQATVDPYLVALVHAALGETDAAFDCLETAFQEGSVRLIDQGKCDARLDPLRSDTRWRNLLGRLGLA